MLELPFWSVSIDHGVKYLLRVPGRIDFFFGGNSMRLLPSRDLHVFLASFDDRNGFWDYIWRKRRILVCEQLHCGLCRDKCHEQSRRKLQR